MVDWLGGGGPGGPEGCIDLEGVEDVVFVDVVVGHGCGDGGAERGVFDALGYAGDGELFVLWAEAGVDGVLAVAVQVTAFGGGVLDECPELAVQDERDERVDARATLRAGGGEEGDGCRAVGVSEEAGAGGGGVRIGCGEVRPVGHIRLLQGGLTVFAAGDGEG